LATKTCLPPTGCALVFSFIHSFIPSTLAYSIAVAFADRDAHAAIIATQENALIEGKEDDDGAGTGETPQGEERQEQAQASEQMQVDPNVLQQLTMYPQVPPGYIPMPPFFMPGVAPGQAFLQQALQFFSHHQQQQHQEEGDGGQDAQTTTQEAGNGNA